MKNETPACLLDYGRCHRVASRLKTAKVLSALLILSACQNPSPAPVIKDADGAIMTMPGACVPSGSLSAVWNNISGIPSNCAVQKAQLDQAAVDGSEQHQKEEEESSAPAPQPAPSGDPVFFLDPNAKVIATQNLESGVASKTELMPGRCILGLSCYSQSDVVLPDGSEHQTPQVPVSPSGLKQAIFNNGRANFSFSAPGGWVFVFSTDYGFTAQGGAVERNVLSVWVKTAGVNGFIVYSAVNGQCISTDPVAKVICQAQFKTSSSVETINVEFETH